MYNFRKTNKNITIKINYVILQQYGSNNISITVI